MTRFEIKDDTKYAIGRNPYPEKMDTNIEVLEWDDLEKALPMLKNLSPQTFRSDRINDLRDMDGFKALAWTPNVRYLYYNPDKDVMVKDVEGDLFVWVNPSDETIGEVVSEWPKGEVALGERYDSRFEVAE